MGSRLWLTARHLKPSVIPSLTARRMMTSFTIQTEQTAPVTVNSTTDLSKEQLLSFPAFNIWFSTLQRSLTRQQNKHHEFHAAPYVLRKVDIQAVDYFKGGRLGFLKFKAEVSNDQGETLPGSVFLRGGSVGMLLVLQPDDIPESSEDGKRAIVTVQPRIPAGSLAFSEIPAGMLDDSGTFAGGAAKEIEEETGLIIPQNELIDMTSLALGLLPPQADGEQLQKGMYPSPGGSDEFIPLFLCQKRMPRKDIDGLQGRLTGLRSHGEKITLKVVPLEQLWKECVRDGKSLAAWALYNGLKQEGHI